MAFDRACGDEQRLRNLAVGKAIAREFGNPTFARRQGVEATENDAAGPGAGGAELGLGPFGKEFASRAVRGVERLAEKFARFGAAIASTQHRAEIGEGARSLQSGVTVLECADGFPEQELSTLTTGHDAGSAFRNSERARGAECPRELELLFGE